MKINVFGVIYRLENWKTVEDDPAALKGPCLVQSSFTIPTTPTDTFLNMSGWHKGVVFVNGFNVGRYWKVGPQQNLYVPAPLLNTGINTVRSKSYQLIYIFI